jgi:hypothetical protein
MYTEHSEVTSEAFETLKRAWFHVRRNRYLWIIAFVIALAGGGAAGFSLWVQSPISRGITGISPLHQIGTRISNFAHGNVAFWALFIIIGFFVGLVVLAAGAFAQAAAIGAVSDIEHGRPSGLSGAFQWGRKRFPRFFLLVIGYLVVLVIFAAPSYLFWWTLGKKGFVLPCVGGIGLGLVFAVVTILAGIMFELSARFLVLEGHGIVESLQLGLILFKDFWKEVVLTWLYVLVITIMGALASVIVVSILSWPLSAIFSAADKNHNAFLIALSILAFLVAWVIASAFTGIFSITASTMWTITFIDLK